MDSNSCHQRFPSVKRISCSIKCSQLLLTCFKSRNRPWRPALPRTPIETWDSLHHLSFVVALEQEFNVQFSPEEIEQLLSIELTTALLEEKLKGNGSSNGSGI